MNWPKRCWMNTQQAPSLVQSARVVPIQLASMNAHCTSGGTISHTRYRANRVRRALSQLENRLLRIQASTPTVLTGGGMSGLKTWAVTGVSSPLDQRDALVVPVHQAGK